MRKEKSCGTITICNGKTLLIKQKEGCYGFPKGHVEKGENEYETAIRETKEETNIDVEIISERRFKTSYIIGDKILKTVVYFLASPLNDDIKPDKKEIEKVLWVKNEDVCKYLSFDNLKDIYKEVNK